MHPDRVFTSLHYLIDGERMREADRLTRKDGATGTDGVTAADYEKDLEADLDDLLGRIKSGSYRAPPVRRHYIPKADGTERPLGIPTFEDKVAQQAILMLLEPIYEGDFLPCSYGFRPGRSAHDALHALRTGIMEQGQRWVSGKAAHRARLPWRRIGRCDSIPPMPDGTDIAALKKALAAAEVKASEAEAWTANAEAKVCDVEAEIAFLKLTIEKLRHEFLGQ